MGISTDKKIKKEIKWFIGFYVITAIIIVLINREINLSTIYDIVYKNNIFLYFAIFIVFCVFEDFNIENQYRDIGVTLMTSGFLYFIYFSEGVKGTGIDKVSKIGFEEGLEIYCLTILFEGIYLLISVMRINKEVGYKRILIEQGLGMSCIILWVSVFRIPNLVTTITNTVTIVFWIIQIIGITLFSIVLYKGIKINKLIDDVFFESFSKYIMARILIHILSSLNYFVVSEAIIIMSLVLKIISSYYVFDIFVVVLVKKRYEHIYLGLESDKKLLTQTVGELNHTKKELQKSLDGHKELLVSLPDGVIVIENEIITFANDMMAIMFRLNYANELEGRNIYSIVHPNDHAKLHNAMKEHAKCQITLVHFNLLGIEFAGETRCVGLKIEKENTYTMIVRDVSERLKMLQMETIFLKKKEEERIKNQVLANISHEFKTPINVIYSAAQLQEQNITLNDWKSVSRYNPMIRQNCNRLIRLINNFIDLTKFDYGEFQTSITCVNLVSVIEEITTSIISFAENRGISVIFDTEEEELYCEVDIELIDRIMLNLLSNAIKYNKPNGSIEVKINVDERYIGVNISDTGVGIEQDKMGKLFNRFERIDKTLARDNEGSGLGLNIVKNMIEHLHGYIEVSSTVGVGTTMTIYFPRLDQTQEEVSCMLEAYEYDYDRDRLKKSIEMEFSDIYG